MQDPVSWAGFFKRRKLLRDMFNTERLLMILFMMLVTPPTHVAQAYLTFSFVKQHGARSLGRSAWNAPESYHRERPPLRMCGETLAEREHMVLSTLSAVIDPDLGSDIVTLGFVKDLRISEGGDNGAIVTFDVELTTPACPVKETFQAECRDLVEALPWVDRAEVTMTAQPMRPSSDSVPTGLSRVANIIAVSSCKGGVGKSTTAVNLAYALSEQGATVGILDADIYGPSLPTMVKPDSEQVEFVGNQIRPLQANGVKLMSYGFVNKAAAIMRGPMVSQLLQQFVTLTSWGELDYLVIDMPPGTGDVQLTLCQVLNITAAVIVTTPQKLSFTDVVKGIDLFDTVNVPSVAVVENMAYIDTFSQTKAVSDIESIVEEILRIRVGDLSAVAHREGIVKPSDDEISLRAAMVAKSVQKRAITKERQYIFGKGHRGRLSDMWGITNTVQVPLVPEVASSGDKGVPFVLENPDGDRAAPFLSLASAVVREVSKLKFNAAGRPVLSYQPGEGTITIDTNGDKEVIKAADLRRQCRCALCVEEFTGKLILDPTSIPENIAATSFAPVGNYAVSVHWSDGHSSLYPYSTFARDYKPTTKRLELDRMSS